MLPTRPTFDIPCYVYYQSSLKTRASHPLKFTPLQPSCDTYKYSFWPRTIIDWNSLPSDYLTMDSCAKFKATISDYIFSVLCLPLCDVDLHGLGPKRWSMHRGPCFVYVRTMFCIRPLRTTLICKFKWFLSKI